MRVIGSEKLGLSRESCGLLRVCPGKAVHGVCPGKPVLRVCPWKAVLRVCPGKAVLRVCPGKPASGFVLQGELCSGLVQGNLRQGLSCRESCAQGLSWGSCAQGFFPGRDVLRVSPEKAVLTFCPFSFIRSTILPLASASGLAGSGLAGSYWLHCIMWTVEIFMNLTWFLSGQKGNT